MIPLVPRALVGFAFVVTVAGCGHGEDHAAPDTGKPVAVRLAAVAADSASLPVLGTGVLTADEELPLAFKIGGVVTEVRVRAGDRVRAGQVLATLDPAEIGARVAQAEAALAKAERDLARAEALHADSAIARDRRDDARTARDLAAADLRVARFNQRHAQVVAPSAGVVLARLAEPGQVLDMGVPVVLFGAADKGQVLRVGLADRETAALAVGDAAQVRFGALAGERFTGRVRAIGAAASPGAGTYEVEVVLDRPVRLTAGGAPASGLVGDIVLTPSRRIAVRVVPVTALLEGDGERGHMWTVEGDSARRLEVRVAWIHGERVGVRSGLEGVERVVAEGAAYLTAGSRVQVAAAAPAAK